MKASNPDSKVSQIAALLSSAWRMADASEKALYEAKAKSQQGTEAGSEEVRQCPLCDSLCSCKRLSDTTRFKNGRHLAAFALIGLEQCSSELLPGCT